MQPTEPRLQSALEAAMNQVKVTAAAVTERVTEVLGAMARSTTRPGERDQMLTAQQDLQRNIADFHRVFKEVLRERMEEELAPRKSTKRALAATDWQSLSLVEDEEVDEKLHADRIAQMILHECEVELRELSGYMSALVRSRPGTAEGNPLRADVLGTALYRAIEAVSDASEVRRLLARDLGQTLARAMPACYAEILNDLKSRGVKPVAMTVRSVEGPGTVMGGANTGYETRPQDWHSIHGTISSAESLGGHTSGHGTTSSGGRMPAVRMHSGHGQADSVRSGPSTSFGGAGRGSVDTRFSTPMAQADAQIMNLFRRLTVLASAPTEYESMPTAATRSGASIRGADSIRTADSIRSVNGNLGHFMQPTQPIGPGMSMHAAGEALSGLMAVNLIRAHREELRQASTGKLDHMVIDVVGSLFDQILSDPRVPPHMARQIARLQLPVLRVAMRDSTFFSSRRHPVRRFVNRIASLACAFEDFEDGPGREFVARVRELVQEIVDGDFDQIDLYEHKLLELEAFIARQTHVEVEKTGAVSTLESKESELRVQQRYMQQLRAALAPLSLPAYLSEFLAQIWSQALVLAVSRDGAGSDRVKRYKRAARDLVMSVQPKGSPALRKKFLMQLPPLMKDLYEGMKFIGWAEAAQKEFFGKLLPAHAESLKGQPLSELDHNMLVKQLESAFNLPVPGAESVSPADPLPVLEDAVDMEVRFTPEEAQAVGLVVESAIDWSGDVDIDVGADSEPPIDPTEPLPLGLDVNLDLSDTEPDEPTRGAALIDHINLGFAYQMHLKDEWQKVRLTYMSPGRRFFVFTRGKKHRETISVTSRMLARMCETGRIRAYESSYLMERATHRARKQLASMQPQPSATRH
jgi:Protein of unknown function (DUF1631)